MKMARKQLKPKFDCFSRLQFLNTNKRILVYSRSEADLADLRQLFLDKNCSLIESQTFDEYSSKGQVICTRKFIKDERIDLAIVVGPIRPEHFAYFDQNCELIAMAARESALCYFNEHYERAVYYESLDDVRKSTY